MKFNPSAGVRKFLYVLTAIVSAIVVIGTAFNLIPLEAVERGAAAGSIILGLITGILAARNVTPDKGVDPGADG